jgi:hypothetical protein
MFRIVLIAICILFTHFSVCVADDTVLLKCNGASCKYSKVKDYDKSTHIALPVLKGKRLIEEVKICRYVDRKKAELLFERSDATKKLISGYENRIKYLNSDIGKYIKHNSLLKKDNIDLIDKNGKLLISVAKHKGERYQYLLIGMGVGAGIVVVAGVAALLLTLK